MLNIGMVFLTLSYIAGVEAYTNLYTLPDLNNSDDDDYCQFLVGMPTPRSHMPPLHNVTLQIKKSTTTTPQPEGHLDPIVNYNKRIHQLVYGDKVDAQSHKVSPNTDEILSSIHPWLDPLFMYPSGSLHRATRFNNRTSVHMPPSEQVHRGHSRLNLTRDHLQTAVNAFFILLYGNLQDVLMLPPDYVLQSVRFRFYHFSRQKARTIAMMKLSREKLAATWTVVKAGKKAGDMTHEQLEQYRPLFKYVSAREMARLNMSDSRILSYIGTHPDLNRHHVGVIASRYIAMNPNWMQPLYLNLMNNLLCGVPIKNMRKVAQASYLQLSHQALGKSYSWSSRDVTRLGLLLSELRGDYLASISPEAMSGISAEVMLEMQPANLKHITDIQRRHMDQRPLNILARKLELYQDKLNASVNKPRMLIRLLILHIMLVLPTLIS